MLYAEAEKLSDDSKLGIAILVLAAMVVTGLAPGMLAVSCARFWKWFRLDRGQMWTFSSLASIAIFAGCLAVTYHTNPPLDQWLQLTGLEYVGISIAIIASLLVCRFGFHAKFPRDFFYYFVDDDPPDLPKGNDASANRAEGDADRANNDAP